MSLLSPRAMQGAVVNPILRLELRVLRTGTASQTSALMKQLVPCDGNWPVRMPSIKAACTPPRVLALGS